MINLVQFSPCGALIVCVLAWMRIVMLSHKIDELEKKITVLALETKENKEDKRCHQS